MDRCHVSDRHFFYLDDVWVTQQLAQLELPVSDQVLRKTTSHEGSMSAKAKLPIAEIDVGTSHGTSTKFEWEKHAGDTPERIFARYYDHLVRDDRLIMSP